MIGHATLLTTQDVIAGIVLGLAGLTAIGAALVKLAHQMADMRDQFNPDHGGSLRDSTDRIESALSDLAADMKRVEGTQRGMARDIGRLAHEDQLIRETADHEHSRIWATIDRKDNHT